MVGTPLPSLSPIKKHSQTPPKTVQTRRKGPARIQNSSERRATFSKRCPGLLKKAEELNSLTDAQVAVIVFSDNDELFSVGKPTVEEIIHRYLRRPMGNVMPSMSQRGSEHLAKKEYASCATTEALTSSSNKLELVVDHLRKKSEHLVKSPVVKASPGNDSGVGVDRSSRVSKDDKIASLKKNVEPSLPSSFDLDNESHWSTFSKLGKELLESSGSSGAESTAMCSVHEDRGIDPDLPKDGNSFLILPKDSAVGNGSLGEESAHSDLEGSGNNEEDIFAGLEKIMSLS